MNNIQKIEGADNRMKDAEAVAFSAVAVEPLSVDILVAVRNSFCVGEPMTLALNVFDDEDDRLLFRSGDVGGHILRKQKNIWLRHDDCTSDTI